MSKHDLELVDESLLRCQVTTWTDGETYELRPNRAGASSIRVRSSADFEDALRRLRAELERQNLLLLCTRYRRDAFVTSNERGPFVLRGVAGEPVSPELLVSF
ncbi:MULTISPECIES: hypothetical protein [unclassified Nonomuraea]|uniref:hypothetical protein n=1 Tax=unclassified Nonomuraea TaxID=2593643 RepID=UPI003410C7BB